MSVFAFTTNYDFKLIDFDTATWHDDEYDNWRSVDALLGTFFAAPGYTGVWANSTAYATGQRAADGVDGKVYEVLIAHTSVASPTLFSADRATNPTFWQEWLASHAGDTNNPHLTPAENVVINGNFDVWQRGTTFTAPATEDYSADRFANVSIGAGVFDMLRSTSVPNNLSDFSLQWDVTTADATIVAGDHYGLEYRVEGLDALQFGLGTADAVSITLSFYVRSPKTGVHCVSFRNNAADRNYIVEYTVSVVNTWEKKTVTLTADTSVVPTWLTDNGIGLRIQWALAAGVTFQGAANTWQAGNLLATSGQVNVMDNVANNFHLAQVKLELGSAATSFEQRPFAQELALCQRYYWKSFQQSVAPAQSAGNVGAIVYSCAVGGAVRQGTRITFPSVMRATPTRTFYNPGAANALWRNLSLGADSGAVNADLGAGEQGAEVLNAQIAGDGAGETIAIHATFAAEL